jgi:hypothetical protein
MADAARATNQCGGCLVPLVIQSSFGYAAGDDFEDRRMSLCACPGEAGHGSPNDVCHRPPKARLVEFAASRFAAPAGGWGSFQPVRLPPKPYVLFGQPTRK